MRCCELDIFKIFLENFWKFFGILWGILEFFHIFFGTALGIANDYLHSKSQLVTKSFLDMKGIDLFVKAEEE